MHCWMDLWTEGYQHNTNMVLSLLIELFPAARCCHDIMLSFFDTADIKTNNCARAMKSNSLKWGGIAPQGRLHRKCSCFSGFFQFVNWFGLTRFTHFHAFSINKNKTTRLQEEQILTMTCFQTWSLVSFHFSSLVVYLMLLYVTQETPPNQQTSKQALFL